MSATRMNPKKTIQAMTFHKQLVVSSPTKNLSVTAKMMFGINNHGNHFNSHSLLNRLATTSDENRSEKRDTISKPNGTASAIITASNAAISDK